MIGLVAALIGGALLEAGGNAFMRQGLLRHWWPLLLAGVATMGAYSVLVNQSGLKFDFGRLMGCYVVAFFVVSQLLAAIVFREVPSARTMIGGSLIIVGGIILVC